MRFCQTDNMSILVGEKNNEILRKSLQEITSIYVGERVDEQLRAIEALRETHGHAINLAQEAVAEQPKTWQYNCFQYAFNLINNPDVIQIASTHHEIYPNSAFVQFLIKRVLCELSTLEDGCVIVYSDSMKVTHAGKIMNQAVASKWGTAHLWQHRIYEVPATYGDGVRFFKAINAEQSGEAFRNYTKEILGSV